MGIPELDSLTLPDIACTRRRDHSRQRSLAGDVLLVIEVSDTTLSKDRGKKAKLYASAGISEYWIVNLKGRCLEARRDPRGGADRLLETLHPGQEVRPLAFPEIALPVSRLFPA